jgi:hypothetical protein
MNPRCLLLYTTAHSPINAPPSPRKRVLPITNVRERHAVELRENDIRRFSNPPDGAIQVYTERPRRVEEGVLGPELPPSIQLCTLIGSHWSYYPRPRRRYPRRRGVRFTPPTLRQSARLPIRENASFPSRTSVRTSRWNYVRNDTYDTKRLPLSPLRYFPLHYPPQSQHLADDRYCRSFSKSCSRFHRRAANLAERSTLPFPNSVQPGLLIGTSVDNQEHRQANRRQG